MRPDGLTVIELTWDDLTPWEQGELLRMGYQLPLGTIISGNADLECEQA